MLPSPPPELAPLTPRLRRPLGRPGRHRGRSLRGRDDRLRSQCCGNRCVLIGHTVHLTLRGEGRRRFHPTERGSLLDVREGANWGSNPHALTRSLPTCNSRRGERKPSRQERGWRWCSTTSRRSWNSHSLLFKECCERAVDGQQRLHSSCVVADR